MKTMNLKFALASLSIALAACSAGNVQSTAGNTQAAATALPARALKTDTTVAVNGELTLGTPSISLAFDQNSKVTTVNVAAGQTVKKGDVLATVDDTSLKDAVEDAKLALALVEANIAQQNTPPSKADLASAQAALSAASASYNTTKAGATQSELETARRNWDAAWLSYLALQVNRDVHCGTAEGTSSLDCKAQEASYGNAFESMLAAKDAFEKLQQPVLQDTLTQAAASVTSAKARLDALISGVTTEQTDVDNAQYAQAKASLERAQANLAKATLVSPCDCIVQAVNVARGAVPDGIAFTLVRLDDLQFKTTNLAENDVAKIKAGAAVSLRLKAYTQTFAGTVASVLAQSSGTESSTALYTALINLDSTSAKLLPGMTGQAEISTK